MQYTLRNSRFTLTFDTLGGELISLKDSSGIEYIWQGDASYWKGHAPVLFPIVGSLRNKEAVTSGGKRCHMERHGVARKAVFQATERARDSITFSLQANSQTLEQFPFAFELKIRYTLDDAGVVTEYTVINKGGETIPYQIGGHPGFNCPLTDAERFEAYRVEFERTETANCPEQDAETGIVIISKTRRILEHTSLLKMDHALFHSGALIFDKLASKKVKLYNPATGHGVQLDFRDFDNLLIWSSANDGPFVALEPWNGLPTCSDEGDVFERKRGVRLLQPHESQSLSYKINVL